MRISPQEFLQIPQRAHAFLYGVPLQDAWSFRLRGGGPGRTLADVEALLSAGELQNINPMVRALFGLRWAMGRLFKWDGTPGGVSADSYIHRLTDEDRARTRLTPGSTSGLFTVVYAFETEALQEIINRTVHAFISSVLVPADDGYTLYWGIYVKPVGGITRLYMSLITPFRHAFIYPAIIRHVERKWKQTYGTS